MRKYGHKLVDCRSKGKPENGGSSYGTSKFRGDCRYCKKAGHKEADCWKKKKKEQGGDQANSTVEKKKKKKRSTEEDDGFEMVLMAFEDDLQVKDTASAPPIHFCLGEGERLGEPYQKTRAKYNPDGTLARNKTREDQDIFTQEEGAVIDTAMQNSEDEDEEVLHVESEMRTFLKKVAQEKRLSAKNIESWIDAVSYKLSDIGITTVSQLHKKIITINKNLDRKGQTMLHMKTLILFAKIMTTNKGFVMGVDMLPSTSKETIAVPMMEQGKQIDINILHKMLGHPREDTTRKTAAFYGWILKGKILKCDHCAIAKAKQAKVAKKTETKSNKVGERIFIDISSVKGESYGSSKFWLLALDNKTDMPTSFFLAKKSEGKTKLIPWIQDLKKKHGIEVKFIRCDDAGENFSLEKACLVAGLGIQFEYTATGTPQYNGRVERKFATLYGCVRSMMNAANIP
jgi:hypothetical protein